MLKLYGASLAGALLMVLPATIHAQAVRPASPGVRMWHDVYAGMSRKDFKSIYANHKGEVSPGCPVAVLGRFSNGRLITLFVEDLSQNDECFANEKERLTNRLGAGTDEVKKIYGGYSAGAFSSSFERTARNTTWKDGALTIKYFSLGLVGKPNIYYTVRTDGKF